MSYGLIVADGGNIQFDTNRRPLEIWKHDYATNWIVFDSYGPWRPLFPNSSPAYHATVSCSCLITVVAVRPTTSSYVVGMPNQLYQTNTDPIEYLVGSIDAGSAPLPSWGLVTYDAAGNVIFNSNARYLKIRQIIDIPVSTIEGTIEHGWWHPPDPVTITHNGIYDPYYIVPITNATVPYVTMGGTAIGPLILKLGIKKISSTSASLAWFVLCGGPGVMGIDYPFYPQISIPDPFRVAICTL